MTKQSVISERLCGMFKFWVLLILFRSGLSTLDRLGDHKKSLGRWSLEGLPWVGGHK